MKKTILIPVFFITLCSFGKSKKNEVDIISYNIEMNLDTISQKIDIHTDIRIQNTDTTGILKFLFCDWIKINKAQLNGKNIECHQGKDTLLVHVDRIRKLNLTLDYTLPVDSFKQDKKEKVIALTRAMKWCPFIYDDISELNSKITIPKGYKVYSSGALLKYTEGEHVCQYKYQNKINLGFSYFLAPTGYYKETTKKQNGTIINYCFHNRDSMINNDIIKESLNSFKFCNRNIGKYNRSQLTYIEFPGFSCAQSLETFVSMGTRFVKLFGLYQVFRDWPSHETIHQWVGAGYFNSISKNKKNRWFIEESLTECLRQEYVEKTYGGDSLKAEFKKTIDFYNKEIKGTKDDVPIAVNLPNDVTYLIGPLILHIVHLEMGDENWHKFITGLYRKHYGKVLDYDLFKSELCKYASQTVIAKMEDSLETKGIPKELINQ
jgi:hypothetical protein